MPNQNKRAKTSNTEENEVQLLAKEVYSKTMAQVDESGLYGIDPLTIIIVIGIIVNIVRVIQECNKDKTSTLGSGEQIGLLSTNIRFRAFERGWLTKFRLNKIIKKHLNKSQYKVYQEPLLETLLEIGKTVKEEQVSALLEHENV